MQFRTGSEGWRGEVFIKINYTSKRVRHIKGLQEVIVKYILRYVLYEL